MKFTNLGNVSYSFFLKKQSTWISSFSSFSLSCFAPQKHIPIVIPVSWCSSLQMLDLSSPIASLLDTLWTTMNTSETWMWVLWYVQWDSESERKQRRAGTLHSHTAFHTQIPTSPVSPGRLAWWHQDELRAHTPQPYTLETGSVSLLSGRQQGLGITWSHALRPYWIQ